MKTWDEYKITGETAVREFPDKYNELVSDLLEEISNLRSEISNKDVIIAQLKTDFNVTLSAIRSECLRKIAELNDKINENQ